MTVALDLLRSDFILHGTPITDAAIDDILDGAYLPLVRLPD